MYSARTVAALLLAFLLQPVPAYAETIAVTLSPIALNPDRPAETGAGLLEFRAGYVLQSGDSRFGGLSGLSIAADGRHWHAVSDTGLWLSGSFEFAADGRLSGLSPVEIAPLNGEDGNPLPVSRSKEHTDAEAIERAANGDLLVSFEGRHRVLRYGGGNLAGKAESLPMPAELPRAPRNGSLEAIAALPDGALLLLTEDMSAGQDTLRGWLQAGGRSRVLELRRHGLFKPTDCTILPNGDVLLVERRYTPIGGPAARLSLLRRADIDHAEVIDGKELMEIALPLNVDNFEGLAAVPDGMGGAIVFLLSDDNFNPLQRTLLLQFHLPAAALTN